MKAKPLINAWFLLAAGLALFSAVAPARAADKKPNILFIILDDMGIDQLSSFNPARPTRRRPRIWTPSRRPG
jgi:hypothetical protein